MLDWTLVVAVIFSLIHLLGPRVHQLLQTREALISSFGGGMAVAYVFLQLVPEIEQGHVLVGDSIHFFVLVGFILFYGTERHLHVRHSGEPKVSSNDIFHWHLLLSWVYGWLIIYTMPEQLEASGAFALVGTLAIGLHIFYKDYVLRRHHVESFDGYGRYVLALAPVAGYLSEVLARPTNNLVTDILTAVLAGYIIYNVFNAELPEIGRSSFSWFAVGAVSYVLLFYLSAAA